MKITHAERLCLDLPFATERAAAHMHRATTHGLRINLWRVETDTGVVGYGEGTGDESAFARVIDRNPFELLHDDSVGVGLQIAIYDAVGKLTGVPVSCLIGEPVRDACPISWWAIDMPPKDWAEEARTAVARGYRSFKLKARPWRDIFAQIEAVAAVVPEDFELVIDFNCFLLQSGVAIPILRQLEQESRVTIFESPIFQWDIHGHQQIRQRITRPICIHFGEPPELTGIQEQVCDGYLLGGRGVSETNRQATVAAAANQPFWLQMPGTGIVTAFAVHFGAVLSHAQWPAVTLHEMWADDLLKQPFDVRDGCIHVPDGPGLGIEVDEDAIDRYRVDPDSAPPKEEFRDRRRILKICWPKSDGGTTRAWYFTCEEDVQREFYAGNMSLFTRGVSLQVIEDDQSPAFTRLHGRIGSKGLHE